MQDISLDQQTADLNTLDDWTLPGFRTFDCCRYDRGHAICGLREAQQAKGSQISAEYRRSFSGGSPAAARHAAAEHIRATDGLVFVRAAR